MQSLRKLLAGSYGKVIIARRLTNAEVKGFERERGTLTRGCTHDSLSKGEERFRRPRAGISQR